VTSGNGLNEIAAFMPSGDIAYGAEDVIDWLL
jgi:hypothetical protein